MATNTIQAQEFIEMLEANTALQAQFAIASPNSLDGVVDFADGKGFVFTRSELEAALKHHPESSVTNQLRQYVHY